jgi:hypothetical protein
VRVVGAHAAIAKERYVVGFVVVDGDRVVQAFSLGAPKDESDASQFHELYARTGSLLGEVKPDEFAVRVSEIPSGKKIIATAHRAEGALLAAAGEMRDLRTSCWRRSQLTRPANLKGAQGSTSEAIRSALLPLLVTPELNKEQKEAALAALGVLVTAGEL